MTFDHKSNITTNKNYNNNRNKKFNKENSVQEKARTVQRWKAWFNFHLMVWMSPYVLIIIIIEYITLTLQDGERDFQNWGTGRGTDK